MTLTKVGRSKLAKARKSLTPAELFFYEHAGYSYSTKDETPEQGHIKCAKSLAYAEDKAANLDWGFCWEPDQDGCSGCDCGSEDCACSTGAEHETFVCLVRDYEGKVLESLGGICSPSPAYSRVIEAELASEALAEYGREIETLDAH